MEIYMPKFGLMEKGTISQWYKAVGDTVEKGEPLCEVEAEKLSNTLDAPATGVLSEIIVQEGEEADVAATIAILTEG